MKIFMFPAALGVAAFVSIRQVFWLTPFPLAFPTLAAIEITRPPYYPVSDFSPADIVCLRDIAEKHQQPVSLNRRRGLTASASMRRIRTAFPFHPAYTRGA
jgi:hypothetical protein